MPIRLLVFLSVLPHLNSLGCLGFASTIDAYANFASPSECHRLEGLVHKPLLHRSCAPLGMRWPSVARISHPSQLYLNTERILL